jgi:hypothetical protein
MFKQFGLYKIGIAFVAVLGLVQASVVPIATVTPNATATYTQGNTNWQDISKTSYNWADANGNNLIDVGETVHFTIDMHKTYWGTHDFDAMKVWVDNTTLSLNNPVNVLTKNFTWDFDKSNANMTNRNWYKNTTSGQWKQDDTWRKWIGTNGGTMSFSFDYTFQDAGTYDLVASVMCSRDLSGLTYWSGATDAQRWNDAPTTNDWNAWTETVHSKKLANGQYATKGAYGGVLQGETKKYSLTVYKPKKIPEPNSLSLMLFGLSGIAGALFVRRNKK